MTACMPPPAPSADGRARERGPAVGVAAGAVEVAADGEVVEVVAGPLRRAGRLAVAAWSSSRRRPGSPRATASEPMPSRSTTPGRKLSITTSAVAARRRNASAPAGALRSSSTRCMPRWPAYA